MAQKAKESIAKGHGTYAWKPAEGAPLLHGCNKIYVPSPLRQGVMEWVHDILCHPGKHRMKESIQSLYTWPKLYGDAKAFCRACGKCQRCKKTSKIKYGLLPEKKGEVAKWPRANAGIWGPKAASSKNGYTCSAHAMAMVGPAAGWLEHAQLHSGEAAAACRCQQILGTAWLARYPRPKEIGFGNGSELKKELRELCSSMGMKPKASLPWSPQPNAILERVHQSLVH